MIKLAIVEDEDGYAKQLKEYIEKYSDESGEEFQVTRYSDGDEIVENYKSVYDIILMDIKMEFMDGMTAAENIRMVDPEVVIIFITNMAQYAIKGYAVDALDYVLKPVDYFAFSQRLKRAVGRISNKNKHYVTISFKGGSRKVDVDQITYIESHGHNLTFYTKTDEYTTIATMKDAEEKMSGESFFRCNKGYLVNLKYVEGIKDGCAVVNGNMLAIARARKNDFMTALTNYIGENIK